MEEKYNKRNKREPEGTLGLHRYRSGSKGEK